MSKQNLNKEKHYYIGISIRCKHIFCDEFSYPIDGYLFIKNSIISGIISCN